MWTVPRGGARDRRTVYEGPHAPEAFQRGFQEIDSQPLQRRQAQARDQEEVIGTFPGDSSALMLVTARLKYIVEHEWGQEEVPGYVEVGGDGRTEGKGGGLEEDGAEAG